MISIITDVINNGYSVILILLGFAYIYTVYIFETVPDDELIEKVKAFDLMRNCLTQL